MIYLKPRWRTVAVVCTFFTAITLFHLFLSPTGAQVGCVPDSFVSKTTANGIGNNWVTGVYARDNKIYASTNGGGISISTDGGASFTTKTIVNGLGNNEVWEIYAEGNTVYAATSGGGLSISTDGGQNFTNRTTVNGLGSNFLYGMYVSGNTIYTAENGTGLSISNNGGSSFVNKTMANGLGGNVVFRVYSVGGIVYAATSGGLSISTNGGISFVNRTTANGLGNDSVRNVYAVGSTIYAATTGGLSISTDGGSSFVNRTTTNGLGNNAVISVFVNGSTIYAGLSAGAGLSISSDGGQNFVTKTSGLGNNVIWDIFATSGVVYAATGAGLSIGICGASTTPTPTPTPTPAATPTLTPTPSPTPTPTPNASPTPTPTATATPTPTPTPTATPNPTLPESFDVDNITVSITSGALSVGFTGGGVLLTGPLHFVYDGVPANGLRGFRSSVPVSWAYSGSWTQGPVTITETGGPGIGSPPIYPVILYWSPSTNTYSIHQIYFQINHVDTRPTGTTSFLSDYNLTRGTIGTVSFDGLTSHFDTTSDPYGNYGIGGYQTVTVNGFLGVTSTPTSTPTPTPTPICAPLAIIAQPQSTTALIKPPPVLSPIANLTVAVSGTGPFTYQWFKVGDDNGLIPVTGTGATSPSLARTSTVFDRSSYLVRVTDNCGHTIDSRSAMIVFTDKRPLMFVPGISGSELRKDSFNGDILWIASTQLISCPSLDELTLNPENSPLPNIIPSDVIRKVGNRDFYDLFINSLTAAGYRESVFSQNGYSNANKPTLFIVPYDWRKTNDMSGAAGVLQTRIEYVKSQFPGMKVDIVAHSMGGLVTQRYILSSAPDHNVNKVITIGSPFLGAPKAINVLETGQFLSTPLGIGSGYFCADQIRDLTLYFKGAHELLPSDIYFQMADRPAFKEAGWDYNNNGYPVQDYSSADLNLALDKKYSDPTSGHPPSTPGSNGLAFHSRPGQDDGRLAPSDISYYHIFGEQWVNTTIGQVIAEEKCSRNEGGICSIQRYWSLKMVPGDGTVPVVSARRAEKGLSLNEPIHQLIPFASGEAADDQKVDHTGLCANENVLVSVNSILSGPNLDGPQKEEIPRSSDTSQKTYNLKIVGQSSITVSDGVHTSNISTTAVESEVPGVSANIMSENALQLVLAKDKNYTVSFFAKITPLLIDITSENDASIDQAVRYLDLNIPAGSTSIIRMGPSSIDPLKYDGDGDGVFETTVQPTVSVTGTAAEDSTPPVVNISSVAGGTSSVVTINATDAVSGVKGVLYSIDGIQFNPYISPFNVDRNQNPVVYAFADDNNGNRSGVVSRSLASILPLAVNGRILASDGRGLRNAVVSMTDPLGIVRTATTSSFGLFSFDNVTAGQQYTFRVQSRQYRFAPVVVTVNDNLTLTDFVGLE